jgi:hypothetical protein
MEIWRQNAKEIERGARGDVNELIREEIEKIEEAGVEAEAVIEENEDGLGDLREDDAEDEDFGLEEEQEQEEFEMDDGRRLEVGVEVREEFIEEERRIVEHEEGQQISGVNEIPEIHLDINIVEEVRENENENGVRIEGEVEVGEIINIADDEGENAGEISDFWV